MIRILTDSTADLTPALIATYELSVIPLYVRFQEEIHRDGVDLTRAEFLQKLAAARELPKTAQPTPADFVACFQQMLAHGDEVLYVGLSADLSGTYASAELALAQMPGAPVSLVDSRNLSMGVGLLAIKAAKLARDGRTRAQIAAALQDLVPRVRTAFMVDRLDYLYKGGRLNAFQAVLGGVLNIHPIIAVQEGRLILAEKIRGSHERALERLLAYSLSRPEEVRPEPIAVTHCGCPEDAVQLAGRVREMVPGAEVLVTEAGAVISSHCGPPTVGILYLGR